MPKDTFIYITCFHKENRSTMGRILGNANDIEDKGALHPGLVDKLQAFHAKHVNISGAEKERMYENHGLVTSADGRTRISRHERRSLQAIGLTELDIKTLEITGDVTVSWFYSRPYKGNGDPPPVEHSSVRFCLKSDGVHVVSPDGKRSTLAVLVVSQYDGLLSYSSKYPADGKIIKDFTHRKKTGIPDVGNR